MRNLLNMLGQGQRRGTTMRHPARSTPVQAVQNQTWWEFFPYGEEPTADDIRKAMIEDAFGGFVGNHGALNVLGRAAYSVMGKHNRNPSECRFALLGPSSTGKTHLARMFADTLQLPMAEISPKSIGKLNHILVEIARACEQFECPDGNNWYKLQPTAPCFWQPGNNDCVGEGEWWGIGPKPDFVLPPMLIFLDEVHALANPIIQGLLKATESGDMILKTETRTVDCHRVGWIIATTDRGDLFDAFDTRFQKITLEPYDPEEIAQIVSYQNADWAQETCDLAAHYCGYVPREALDFAREMRREHDMNPGHEWADVAKRVAHDMKIDEWGMTYQRVAVLRALALETMSKERVAAEAMCKTKELEKYVMPPLLRNRLVTITSRGYNVTQAGRDELAKRGMSQ